MDSAILNGCVISCDSMGLQRTLHLFPGIGVVLRRLIANSSEMSRDFSPYQFMDVTILAANLERPRQRSCKLLLDWLKRECKIIVLGPPSNTNPLWSPPRVFFRPSVPG